MMLQARAVNEQKYYFSRSGMFGKVRGRSCQ